MSKEINLRELRLKIALAGGGTGGHTYPLIAVFRTLKKICESHLIILDSFYIGPDTFNEEIFNKEGIKIVKIISGKWRAYFSPLNFIDIFKLLIGTIQAFFKLWRRMPDIIFSKGGYGALPTVIAGYFLGIPVVIHESDAVPGKSNKIAAIFAKKIVLAFETAKQYFLPEKTAVAGNPIRDSILHNNISQEEGKKYFGFLPDKPLVLFLGGSQGSQRINDLVLDSIEMLLKNDIQVIHQAGPKNYKEIVLESKLILDFLPEPYSKFYQVRDFLNEKDYLYVLAAADLIVSRAGSGAIFEIAAAKKPSILIPLPEAARNHQHLNAIEYVRYNAAVVLEEKNATPNLLMKHILDILNNQNQKALMINGAKLFIKKDAAEEISKIILEVLQIDFE